MNAIYQSICDITGELAKEGIEKTHKNTQGTGYMFRSIDDIYSSLASKLSKHQVCMLPVVLEKEVKERINTKGTTLFYVSLKVQYDLVSAKDGSKHSAVVASEAFDSGDKATNKAMSAAYKYAAIQVFCIPVEGDNDADASTHEIDKSKEIISDIYALMGSMTEGQNKDQKLKLWTQISGQENYDLTGWDYPALIDLHADLCKRTGGE